MKQQVRPPPFPAAAKSPSPRSGKPLEDKIDTPLLAPGTIIDGKYKVIQRVAAGGMGEIYSVDPIIGGVVDPSKRCALKIMKSGKAGPEMTRRFGREFDILSKFNHPNILRVYDYGTLPNGDPYFTMDLLEGRSLFDIQDSTLGKRLPYGHVVEMAIQISNGLEEIHKTSIHRDIKPANIFLTTAGQIIILDFGLAIDEPDAAASAEEDQTIADRLTSTNVAMGTTNYMAPELFTAQGGRAASAQSDMYSLGATMFKLLSGKPPFDREDQFKVIVAQVGGEKPDILDFECSDPRIKGELIRIVNILLERNPDLRFSATTLKARLRELLPNRVDLGKDVSVDESTILGASHFVEVSTPAGTTAIPLARKKVSAELPEAVADIEPAKIEPAKVRPGFIVGGLVVAAGVAAFLSYNRFKPEPDLIQPPAIVSTDAAVADRVSVDASSQLVSYFTPIGGNIKVFSVNDSGQRTLVQTLTNGNPFEYLFTGRETLIFEPDTAGRLVNGSRSLRMTLDPNNPPNMRLFVTRQPMRAAPRAIRPADASAAVEEPLEENPEAIEE
jgi:serine/threonine protein kinase